MFESLPILYVHNRCENTFFGIWKFMTKQVDLYFFRAFHLLKTFQNKTLNLTFQLIVEVSEIKY